MSSGAIGDALADGTVAATWIRDLDGQVWLASRYSEHVVCARGEPVISAGEAFVPLSSEFPAGFEPALEFRRCPG